MFVSVVDMLKEVKFKTSRSGGAGGQNVNKVETKVLLIWDFNNSNFVTDIQKFMILNRLSNRIQIDGLLFLECSETRSQSMNKEIAVDRLVQLLNSILVPKKRRIATKIPKSKIIARLDRKSRHADKKSNRRWRLE